MSKNTVVKTGEFRATARIDATTAKRLDDVAEKTGLGVSDLVRISVMKFLPEAEAGRIDFAQARKKAA